MAREAHLRKLKQGVAAWNQWRQKHPEIKPDLSHENIFKLNLGSDRFRGADFSQVNFTQTYLHVFDFSGADFRKANLSEANLTSSDLSRADLRDADLKGTVFRYSDLSAANLSGTDLRQARLEDANLRGADLSRADLGGMDLRELDLSGTNLSRANLRAANLSGVNLNQTNLSGAHLTDADLSGAKLEAVDLSGADLSGLDLRGLDLRTANLRDANLRRANLFGMNLAGVNLRQANLKGANLVKTNLGRTNLSGIVLSGASLGATNLAEANLNGVDLGGMNLGRVDLSGVDLSGVDLGKADLRNARLRGASLAGLNLSGKNLSDADLKEADLRRTNLCEANLNRADLERANVTGALIFRTTREDWRIEGIQCDYIFCDPDGKVPFPGNRVFRTGEFERLFRQLPTIEYVLEHGFASLDALIMDQVVQDITEKHPEFDLKLDSFHSRGQPHATFTVQRRQYSEEALQQVKAAYETRIARLEAGRGALESCLNKAIEERLTMIRMLELEEKYRIEARSASGGGDAPAPDIDSAKAWRQLSRDVDFARLADELGRLKQELQKTAQSPDQYRFLAEVAQAEAAARAQDGLKVVEHLRMAGQWAFDAAQEVGVDAAADFIRKAISA
jgi:uncharacterized protein YjbI with pentapeptide repeats